MEFSLRQKSIEVWSSLFAPSLRVMACWVGFVVRTSLWSGLFFVLLSLHFLIVMILFYSFSLVLTLNQGGLKTSSHQWAWRWSLCRYNLISALYMATGDVAKAILLYFVMCFSHRPLLVNNFSLGKYVCISFSNNTLWGLFLPHFLRGFAWWMIHLVPSKVLCTKPQGMQKGNFRIQTYGQRVTFGICTVADPHLLCQPATRFHFFGFALGLFHSLCKPCACFPTLSLLFILDFLRRVSDPGEWHFLLTWAGQELDRLSMWLRLAMFWFFGKANHLHNMFCIFWMFMTSTRTRKRQHSGSQARKQWRPFLRLALQRCRLWKASLWWFITTQAMMVCWRRPLGIDWLVIFPSLIIDSLLFFLLFL